jgi:hypothetical protein
MPQALDWTEPAIPALTVPAISAAFLGALISREAVLLQLAVRSIYFKSLKYREQAISCSSFSGRQEWVGGYLGSGRH